MRSDKDQRDPGALGGWMWTSALITIAGYGAIVLTVFMNGATLFDYNGKSTTPEELSGLEALIVFEFLALGASVCALLRKAWVAKRPGSFRFFHALPIGVAFTSILMALLAAAFAVSEIVN